MKIGKIQPIDGGIDGELVVDFKDKDVYGSYWDDKSVFIALELFDDCFEDEGNIDDLIKKYRDAAQVYQAAYKGLMTVKKKVKFNK